MSYITTIYINPLGGIDDLRDDLKSAVKARQELTDKSESRFSVKNKMTLFELLADYSKNPHLYGQEDIGLNAFGLVGLNPLGSGLSYYVCQEFVVDVTRILGIFRPQSGLANAWRTLCSKTHLIIGKTIAKAWRVCEGNNFQPAALTNGISLSSSTTTKSAKAAKSVKST